MGSSPSGPAAGRAFRRLIGETRRLRIAPGSLPRLENSSIRQSIDRAAGEGETLDDQSEALHETRERRCDSDRRFSVFWQSSSGVPLSM
jgi:hypothetical protein